MPLLVLAALVGVLTVSLSGSASATLAAPASAEMTQIASATRTALMEHLSSASGEWNTVQPQTVTADSESPSAFDEVIVVLARGAQTASLSRVADAAGAKLEHMHSAGSGKSVPFAVYSSKALSPEQLAKKFEGLPGVIAVSPNYEMAFLGVPNDPLFEYLWGLENTGQVDGTVDADIDASSAWDYTAGSGAVVAVIDSGVDYGHEDLAANIWINPGEIPGNALDDDGNGYVDDIKGIDAYTGDMDPMDEYGHGTHVAGTIAAVGNNATGVAGVAYQAQVMALRVGDTGVLTADAIECIDYAIDMKENHGVNVVAINASWGSYTYSAALEAAIQAAGAADIVFVAAAGNDGLDTDVEPLYPAAFDCPNIISVGASDTFDDPASFSNYGDITVDLFAPGTDILSSVPTASTYWVPDWTDPFYDDMESGDSSWITIGDWYITTEWFFASPTHSLTDSPYSDYANNTDKVLITSALDLSSLAAEPQVCAYFGCDVDLEYGYDFLGVLCSGNNGADWMVLDVLTGTGSGYVLLDLPAAVLTSQFRLAFELLTDEIVTRDGVYIDDVAVGAPDFYEIKQGTSMAAPHVAGVVALLAAQAPSETAATRIDRILASVDKPSGLLGWCQTDGRLNAATALATNAVAPTITDVSPASGSTLGGTSVTITGTDFTGATDVTFGGAAACFIVDSPTQITATAPTHSAGTVQVEVTTLFGTSADTSADDFTYVDPPTVTAVSPAAGPVDGGTSVIITGTDFASTTSVTFGGTESPAIWVDSDVQITCLAPAHTAGTVQVQVVTAYGSSANTSADDFTYLAPTRYDNNNPLITYAPDWSHWDNSGYWAATNDTYAYTDKPGDKAVVSFEGTQLSWIACTSNTKGKALVTLDPGTPGEATQTVDLYSPTTLWKQTVYSTGLLADGTHTLVIECLYEKHVASYWYTIDLDGFDILGTLVQAPVFNKVDDNDYAYCDYQPGIVAGWSDTVWSRWDASGYWAAYDDTYAYTDQPGFKVTFTFEGMYASWVACTSNTKGKALVTLDGNTAEAEEVDLYSPSTLWKQTVYDTGLLAEGTHTIEIECLGTMNSAAWWHTIDVDRFDVIESTP